MMISNPTKVAPKFCFPHEQGKRNINLKKTENNESIKDQENISNVPLTKNKSNTKRIIFPSLIPNSEIDYFFQICSTSGIKQENANDNENIGDIQPNNNVNSFSNQDNLTNDNKIMMNVEQNYQIISNNRTDNENNNKENVPLKQVEYINTISQQQLMQINPNNSPIKTYFRHTIRSILDTYINPIELNFVPKEQWITNKITVRYVFENFFKARSTKNLRFEHKLWNALSLSKYRPDLIPYLGIFWLSKDLMKVNRDIFGALINVTKPAAALFNSQGSFLTHGFVEVSKEEAMLSGIPLQFILDVDESIIRLFRHRSRFLTADSTKGDILCCRWNKEML